jgi:hypothetical protein
LLQAKALQEATLPQGSLRQLLRLVFSKNIAACRGSREQGMLAAFFVSIRQFEIDSHFRSRAG